MSPPCIICDAISCMIQTPLDKHFGAKIELTGAEDPVSWNCKVHEPVLVAANYFDTENIRGRRLTLEKRMGQPVFRVDGSTLYLVRRDDVPNYCGMGHVVQDPAWIDLDLIQGLIDNCKRQHGELCEGFPFCGQEKVVTRPGYLIDLLKSCIVPTSQVPADVPFVSLSYPRGSSGDNGDYLSLTMANIETLRQPGVLDDVASNDIW